MRVLVTGGAGYIGNELVYALSGQERIEEIIVYDNLLKGNYNLFTGLRKLPSQNVRFIQADILDSRSLQKAMSGIDVVYHLAGKVSMPFADQNPHEYEQVNHWGTAELVYAAEVVKPKKVVYLSSAAVYGQGEVYDVSHDCAPFSYYGISKLRGESHMMRLMDQLPVYILRCANAYGYSKNLRIETLVNRMMFGAHFFNKVEVHGDREATHALIEISQAVKTLASLIETGINPGVYNLGQRNVSAAEIVDILRNIYPSLESLYVDQHLNVNDLYMGVDASLPTLDSLSSNSFLEDLLRFKEKFTF